MQRSSDRLVVLTNIPTPYRIAFFNVLAEVLRVHGADLHVLFCAERESNRHWKIDLTAQRYSFAIMRGWHPELGAVRPHINPGIIPTLLRSSYRWLLCAGAWNTPTVMCGAGIAALRGKPRIFWSEGHTDAVLYKSGAIAGARRAVLGTYSAFAVPNSRSEEFIYNEIGKRRVMRLANTVDEDVYRAAKTLRRDAPALRVKYGLPQDRVVIVSVAELIERKGIATIIEALGAARDGAHVALVGQGPLSKTVAASGLPVTLLGARSQAEVCEVLAASDAFILASLVDPNPLASIEAAFAGLPLLLSRAVGNVDELIVEGETGFAFAAGDAVSLGAALQKLVAMGDSDRRALGERASEVAERAFTRERVATTFVDALFALA
jgi:glycosyltransferase involved in cell wall biosynthesis